jgi:hypothetical protein
MTSQLFQRLDPIAVSHTAGTVAERIAARFPDRQLRLVAEEVRTVVDRVKSVENRNSWHRPLKWACAIVAAGIGLLAAIGLSVVVRDVLQQPGQTRSAEWVSLLESGLNDLVFAAVAIGFLLTVAGRLDRRAILRELHGLRSLAHVIDMHQLTKDPEKFLSQPTPTDASVVQTLTATDLGRYLDYCSELLSIVSKTAALYAQVSTDPVVLDTVSEIESLTSGLTRKIWQKISLLHPTGHS